MYLESALGPPRPQTPGDFSRGRKVTKSPLKGARPLENPGRRPKAGTLFFYFVTLRPDGLVVLLPVLWADAGWYFCAQSYRKCWLPRGARHGGAVRGCSAEMIDSSGSQHRQLFSAIICALQKLRTHHTCHRLAAQYPAHSGHGKKHQKTYRRHRYLLPGIVSVY